MDSLERRYSIPPELQPPATASEDLHAWSIYRQNLNSDFTDSALGSSEKSPLPYGNFQLRESTVQSILSHPRYGPKSSLGANMYTYLKFGLPRVFPPARGSSGYDSSQGGGGESPPRRNRHLQQRGGMSRSDPDLIHAQNNGSRLGVSASSRHKSSSEANLLAHEYTSHHQRSHRSSRLHAQSELGINHLGTANDQRRMSIAVLPSSRPATAGPGYYNRGMPMHEEFLGNGHDLTPATPFKYPHLQLRQIEAGFRPGQKNNSNSLLQGVTCEVFAGELLAIMATSEEEGRCLLEVLSGRQRASRGDILLNGHTIRGSQLADRCAYVRQDTELDERLTVKQTLQLTAWLRRPATKTSLGMPHRISQVLDELGLAQVRNTKVWQLTASERIRLDVATKLLHDTAIIALDQPTKEMDIFDTFFLIDFLRRWALGDIDGQVGRIVVLTLHPPTFEIFAMVSRVVLISTGRVMFSGMKADMLPYFSAIEYPCPAYKNPSDYYLDLVTLDALSAEAMLESSQRIEQLSETYRVRGQPNLSDPGPPTSLPARSKPASLPVQTFALLLRALVYSQPLSLLSWLGRLLLSVAMSLVVGCVFWDLPSSDPMLIFGDRLGFIYSMGCLAPLPILLVSVLSIKRERAFVFSDARDGLYSRGLFYILKIFYSLPTDACIWIAFLIPAYSMSGLHDVSNDTFTFYIYLGYLLLVLLAIQALLSALCVALPSRMAAISLAGLLLFVLALASGFTVHLDDLGPWKASLGVASPLAWLLPEVARAEHSPTALTTNLICKNKQVQHQDIIVQAPCPVPNGTAALQFAGMLPAMPSASPIPAVATIGFAVFWLLFGLLAFVFTNPESVSTKSRQSS